MSDKEYTISDMIGAATAGSPSDFQTAFNSNVMDRVAAAIEAKKIEVAKNYFNYEDPVETETVEQEEESNEDTETAAGA